jgi:nicotinamide-nucleotide amidase
MIDRVVEILKERGDSISFAESCTGGRVASAFTSISGVSSIFNGSVVTYSNEIKSNWLGVKEETLIKYGAVSLECVSEMLDGVIKMSGADGAVAISGIAGPDGGTKEKPVGTVYIGVKYLDKKVINRYMFKGSRDEVQRGATDRAIELFFKIL